MTLEDLESRVTSLERSAADLKALCERYERVFSLVNETLGVHTKTICLLGETIAALNKTGKHG